MDFDNKDYIIRFIEKNDFHYCYLDLLNQLSTFNIDQINIIDFNEFIDNLNNNHMIYVIEDINSQLIIGTGTLLIENKIIHNMGKLGHIEDIVIHSKYRGQKLGKYLINFLSNMAKELNCYKVILDCNDENIFFYEKFNFKRNGNQMSIYF